MARTIPVYTFPGNRFGTDFFGRFQLQPITDAVPPVQTNVLDLQPVDDGVASAIGTVTGVGDPGNDRRLYLLDSFSATDMEAHLTVAGTGTGPALQVGVACRVKAGGTGILQPIIWSNVFFGTTGTLLPGCWDYQADGLSGSFNTNQATSPAAFSGYPRSILSATGNGTTTTITMAERHFLDVVPESGALVVVGNALFPGDPFVGVTAVLDPFTFQVGHSGVGTQAGGTITWPFWPPVYRTIAARLVGTTFTAKQWPTDYAPEPAWTDTVKTGTVVMPGTLIGGTPFPSGVGGAGFLLAHMGGPSRADIRKFEVIALA